ncbi:MAG: hypothetical protein MJY76_03630 [Bacteroidales bacterium]|nr:hypothetical protein [Bacteroidales bacterium]
MALFYFCGAVVSAYFLVMLLYSSFYLLTHNDSEIVWSILIMDITLALGFAVAFTFSYKTVFQKIKDVWSKKGNVI